jgi:hypothetical protein
MATLPSTIYLVLAALFFAYTAWTSAAAPESFANQLGLSIVNQGGVNEVRSQYAGFFLAGAILCVMGLAGVVSRPATYITLVVTFGGLIGGRLVSLAINGGMTGYGRSIRALYVIDGVGFATAVYLLMAAR